jgi:hypothetical protein
MMKEEKELRRLLNPDGRKVHKGLNDAITALVKAVREDCAKVADSFYGKKATCDDPECAGPGRIAAAIRRK